MSKREPAEPSTHVLARAPTVTFASVELIVLVGMDRGQRLRLLPGTTRVGTAASCGFRLTDPAVSRVHCELSVDISAVRIVDAGSTNGTVVDGVDIEQAKLVEGSTIHIGNTTLRVEVAPEPLRVVLSPRESFGEVIGASAEMRRIYAIMERVAPTDATVLIQGETGTGKDVIARSIHQSSKRSTGPFVTIDCGGIAESLIESELFGHVRGAFSGAVSDRVGLFEQANGGTVFLDEIGELPLQLQPKLLRALEAREVRRVGDNTARSIDVRVLAATNRPLARSVNDGSFREDLYYRLAVFEVCLPPLRARREDIPRLADHFYRRITDAAEALSPEILASLSSRGWPGNVRELRNFIERTVCLGWTSSRGESPPRPDVAPVPVLDALLPQLPFKEARLAWIAQFETLYVASLLRRANGNVSRAAQMAEVNRSYLHRLIAERGIRGAKGPEDPSDS
jgi:transcriptional regulator with GAF, ATPase, and Fis domain